MNPFAEQEAWEEHQIGSVNILEFCYYMFFRMDLIIFSVS